MRPTLKQKLRYRFDNLMSRGPAALIGWLGVTSLALVLIAALVISLTGLKQDEGTAIGFVEAAWESLMRTLDPGTMGGDTGWGFRIVMLGVTIGGILIVSLLIGILANGISNKLDELRKGHSFVIEKNHTLILGWSGKIFPIISEIVIANENQKNSSIVILASRDKVEMEDEIRIKIPHLKNTRVICRSGDPIDPDDLKIVNPDNARSILILAGTETDPDIHVIKTILAILNNPGRKKGNYHIVAEINDSKNKEVASMIGKDETTLVHSEDLIARVIAQTCRQSGLSIVYDELLGFSGDETYFQHEPGLAGRTFKDALHAYEDSSVIGIRFSDGSTKINPPMDTVFGEKDMVIAISEDDDTVILSGKKDIVIDMTAFADALPSKAKPEKTLILGWNRRGVSIIRELDNYLAKGSSCTIVSDTKIDGELNSLKKQLKKQSIQFKNGEITDRKVLEKLNLKSFNHIIILCYSDALNAQEADSRTLITLLHLRNISENLGTEFSIVSEMMDIKNKQLAEVTKADDFIISNKLISAMLSQLSENRELKTVFDDLFASEGSEIYLKPITNYVNPGTTVNFYTVLESAARKNEVAIGYRRCRYSHDASKSYGVVVNPDKSDMMTFDEKDKAIVIAEE
jgi:Trk K+ transport system NAD-binding subunit